ncbi:MAG: hypothetical protein ABI977_05095 [Acidobacteriota bacterium]
MNPSPIIPRTFSVTVTRFGQTATAHWLLLAGLLLSGGLFAILLKADRSAASASASRFGPPLPALQGQPAVDYLKDHGLYEQLRAWVEAGITQHRPAGRQRNIS